MSNYARLDENNVVINIECAEPEWVAEQPDPSIFVAYTDENPAGIGYTYDEELDEFVAPEPVIEEESVVEDDPIS
jgi:hypothetical protein